MTELAAQNTLNLTANATTTAKSTKGILCKLIVFGIGSGGTVDVYDNTAGSGTKLWAWVTADGKVALDLNVRFSTGLTVVVAGGALGYITYN